MVAVDIESLYCSIQHVKVLKVVRYLLSSLSGEQQPYCNFILDLLDFLLRNNIFDSQGQHYLQIQGIAMNTLCTPSYVSLYLAGWERSIFLDDVPCLIMTQVHAIDDVLIV